MSKTKKAEETKPATNSVHLHRVFRASPEKVYRAFLDPDALVKWLPPNGFTCKMLHMDPKVGGGVRFTFTNFTTGKSHTTGGATYHELVPNERIRYSGKFDPAMPGEMQTTVTLKKVLCGTDVTIFQEGIPAAIPSEMCYLGWQESLAQLKLLVEPEIPD